MSTTVRGDDTLAHVKADSRRKDRAVKVISFSRNFGHQEAVSAGMAKSSGDAVIIIDCDLQDPPEVIPEMIQKVAKPARTSYTGNVRKRKGRNRCLKS